MYRQPVAAQIQHQKKRDDERQARDNQLAHGRYTQHHIIILHDDDKKCHRTDTGQQDITRHAFAVEHQPEGQKDECRTCLFLHHDTGHRRQNKQQDK